MDGAIQTQEGDRDTLFRVVRWHDLDRRTPCTILCHDIHNPPFSSHSYCDLSYRPFPCTNPTSISVEIHSSPPDPAITHKRNQYTKTCTTEHTQHAFRVPLLTPILDGFSLT